MEPGMRKHVLQIIVVALVVCLTIGMVLYIGEKHARSQLCHRMEEGFDITGTFAYKSSLSQSIYFERSDNTEFTTWAARTEEDSYTKGVTSNTGDPNIYLLTSDDGEPYATVHVAYTSNEDGLIFISLDGRTYMPYEKIANSRVTYNK